MSIKSIIGAVVDWGERHPKVVKGIEIGGLIFGAANTLRENRQNAKRTEFIDRLIRESESKNE